MAVVHPCPRRVGTRCSTLALTLTLVAPAALVAQENVTFKGQVRPRIELRDTGGDADAVSFTSMRVRADLAAALDRGVQVFVQMQDVRIWGEEQSTLGDFSADHLDLHQGYLSFGLGEDQRFTAKVGRQETNLGGQRLVGAVGWTPQGRSFDGIRLSNAAKWGSLDLLAYKLREGDLGGDDADLLGVYATIDAAGQDKVDVYALYNSSELAGTGQTTFGTRFHGSRDRLTYRAELSIQRGERGDEDVSAYMLGVRVGTAIHEGRGALAIWYDHLSGDDDGTDGEARVFDTLFATNHKFYGLADLFLNIPVHTRGLGLRDLALKWGYQINDDVRLSADIHHFMTAHQGQLSGSSLGQELDLTLTYRYTGNLGFSAGHSIVFADDPLIELGRVDGNANVGYVMINATF